MTVKFFRNERGVYKFDPETCKAFVYEGRTWKELTEPDRIEEIRFRTVELSRSQALKGCGLASR